MFLLGEMFPSEHWGDAFVTLHGSRNRAKRTGDRAVRTRFQSVRQTGVYKDVMTGFVASNDAVWGAKAGAAPTSYGTPQPAGRP